MKVRSVVVRRVWDCMLCSCVNEEGGDRGEGVGLEAPSLPSYTLRYVSLAELGTVCRVGLHYSRIKKGESERIVLHFFFHLFLCRVSVCSLRKGRDRGREKSRKSVSAGHSLLPFAPQEGLLDVLMQQKA